MSYKLNVNIGADPAGSHKLLYNFPPIKYTMIGDGSATFESNTNNPAISMYNENANSTVNYTTRNLYLFSGPNVANNNFDGSFNIIPSNPTSSTNGLFFSPTQILMNNISQLYGTISHLLVIKSTSITTPNTDLYFVIPVSYTNTNQQNDSLDNLIIDISNSMVPGKVSTGNEMIGYMAFNNVLNDDSNIYYYTDAANNIYVFCQDVFYSPYLYSPPLPSTLSRISTIVDTSTRQIVGGIGQQGNAVTNINSKMTIPAGSELLISNYSSNVTASSIITKILDIVLASNTVKNTFYIDTMNYNISSDSSYEYVGCTVLDDGINGTTNGTSSGYDPNETKATMLIGIMAGAVISIALLATTPWLHWMVIQGLKDTSIAYDYFVCAETYIVGLPKPTSCNVKSKGIAGIDYILFGIYVVVAVILLGCGFGNASPNPDVNRGCQIASIMMGLLVYLLISAIKLSYKVDRSGENDDNLLV